MEKQFKLDAKGDVSLFTDLISLLEELASAEKHAKNNFEHFKEDKNKSERWLEISNDLRNMRQKYLTILVKEKNGEVFCFSKHLLIAMKNCDEVGNRFFFDGETEEAKVLYEDRIKLINYLLEVNEI